MIPILQRGLQFRSMSAIMSPGLWETLAAATSARCLSDSSRSTISFRPRRRPNKDYRPLKPRGVKKKGPMDPNGVEKPLDKMVELGSHDSSDPLEATYGPLAADAIRYTWKQRNERNGQPLSIEEQLRMVDYMTTEEGTTEDLVGERRALAQAAWDEKDRKQFMKGLDEFIEKERIDQLELDGLGSDDEDDKFENMTEQEEEKYAEDDEFDAGGRKRDPNQLAFGTWGEALITVDRVQKVQRGGTMVRYRALVIGGNLNGCAGFGVGKANSPNDATEIASRMARRNIFFVDRYQGSGLTRDLVGRHNSCKVILRAVQPNRGLSGHDLIELILKYFGISDCSSKSHGNRNVYNVVYATFKAILTHESLEEIALKRGKRILSLDRAKRLQI